MRILNTDIAKEYYIERIIKFFDYSEKEEIEKYRKFEIVKNVTILYVKSFDDYSDFEIKLIKSENISDSYYFEHELATEINNLSYDILIDCIPINIFFFQYNNISMENFQYDIYLFAKKRQIEFETESENESEPESEYSSSSESETESEMEIKFESESEIESEPESEIESESDSDIEEIYEEILKIYEIKDNKHYYDRQVNEKKYENVIKKFVKINHITITRIEKINIDSYILDLINSDRTRDFLFLPLQLTNELIKPKYNNSIITIKTNKNFFKQNDIKSYKEFAYDFSISKQMFIYKKNKELIEYTEDLNKRKKKEHEIISKNLSKQGITLPEYKKEIVFNPKIKLCNTCKQKETLKGTLCNSCKYKKSKESKVTESKICESCGKNFNDLYRLNCKVCHNLQKNKKEKCNFCNIIITKQHMTRHVKRFHKK